MRQLYIFSFVYVISFLFLLLLLLIIIIVISYYILLEVYFNVLKYGCEPPSQIM